MQISHPDKPMREAFEGSDTSLLVLSCDKYSDAWEPFFFFLFHFWPTCPFPIYLCANRLTFPDARVQMLHIQDEKTDWSTGFSWAVNQIHTPHFILMLEDYFLSAAPHDSEILQLIDYAKQCGAGYLRFVPLPPPDEPCTDQPLLGIINKGSPYRSSSQASWWRKSTLQKIIKAGETPWEFELRGAPRSCQLDEPFLSLRENVGYPLEYFTTAILKGKWEPGAVAMCAQYGIHLDLKRRPIMTKCERTKRKINASISHPIAQAVKQILRIKKLQGRDDGERSC
jgi:hypothetical protein